MEWLPIETAPKDGSYILLWWDCCDEIGEFPIAIARWQEEDDINGSGWYSEFLTSALNLPQKWAKLKHPER